MKIGEFKIHPRVQLPFRGRCFIEITSFLYPEKGLITIRATLMAPVREKSEISGGRKVQRVSRGT